MKKFKEYLAESSKKYSFVIKFASKPSDETINSIETWLKKYDLIDMSSLTAIENSQKDFIDITDKDVHQMSIIIGMPISQYILLQDIKSAANIPEKCIVVRSDNEPIEQYSSFNSWERTVNKDAVDDGLVPAARISTSSTYTNEEEPVVKDQLFGDEYNKKLLSYLKNIENERATDQVDPPAPLFSWLSMKNADDREPAQDITDFNANIDSLKPATTGSKEPPISDTFLTNSGTISDNALPSVKFFKNEKTGATKQVLKPVEKK